MVRLTDRSDITIVDYRGRKTTIHEYLHVYNGRGGEKEAV